MSASASCRCWSTGWSTPRAVRATTDVRGFAVNRADFDRLVESDVRIALAMLRGVASRLVATDKLLTAEH